jgi:hypothetical protein
MNTDTDVIAFLETQVLPLLSVPVARALLLDAIEAEQHPHEVPALRHTKQVQRGIPERVTEPNNG